MIGRNREGLAEREVNMMDMGGILNNWKKKDQLRAYLSYLEYTMRHESHKSQGRLLTRFSSSPGTGTSGSSKTKRGLDRDAQLKLDGRIFQSCAKRPTRTCSRTRHAISVRVAKA